MKRFTGFARVLAVLMLMMVVLSACGGSSLSGTYEATDGSGSMTFKGSNVTVNNSGVEVKFTYKIKGDEITLKYASKDVADIMKASGQDTEMKASYEKSGKFIYIDGTEFEKK